jgi:toxin ParE1/3/4
MARINTIWSPAGQQDLIDIWGYFVRLASAEIADGLIGEIIGATELIAKNPFTWRERSELLRGIHGLPVHPYTVFYRVVDGVPEIVRALHERRDPMQIFSAAAARSFLKQ